jgi:transposase
LFDKWEKEGLNSLPNTAGRGVKTRLKCLEEVLSKQLEIHSRNLKNVLLHLEEKHNIRICKKTLQNFLKETGL